MRSGENSSSIRHVPVIACFVTSRQSRGVLPSRKFAEAIRELEKERDIQTVLLGAPGDQTVLAEAKGQFSSQSFHRRGQTSFAAVSLLS